MNLCLNTPDPHRKATAWMAQLIYALTALENMVQIKVTGLILQSPFSLLNDLVVLFSHQSVHETVYLNHSKSSDARLEHCKDVFHLILH